MRTYIKSRNLESNVFMSRPRSGDSGYYSRPPPAIVRSSASPDPGPVAARPGDSNPFAAYRSFEQFRSNKQGAATSRQQDRWQSVE